LLGISHLHLLVCFIFLQLNFIQTDIAMPCLEHMGMECAHFVPVLPAGGVKTIQRGLLKLQPTLCMAQFMGLLNLSICITDYERYGGNRSQAILRTMYGS